MAGERELVDLSPIESRQAEAKIVLEARCRLIALLGRLRQQLHDDSRHGPRNVFRAFVRRNGRPRNMGMHEFHGIGRRKGECPRQHLVQNDAHRVKIASRINRSIHPPRLFRGHVRQRTGDELRSRQRLTLTRHTRCDSKTGEPNLIAAGIDQNVGWFDVFVNQLTMVQTCERRCETDGNPEETRQLYRCAAKPVERFSSRIAEDKRLLSVVL